MASMVKIYKDYGGDFSDDDSVSTVRRHKSLDLNNNRITKKQTIFDKIYDSREDVQVYIYEDDNENTALFEDQIDIQNGTDINGNEEYFSPCVTTSEKKFGALPVSGLKIEKRTGPDGDFKCPKCHMTFAYSIYYQYHLTNSKCSGRRFEKPSVSEKEIKEHIQKEKEDDKSNKVYKCNVCSATFTRMFSLKRHLIIHSGDRPYKCPYCKLGFRTSGNLIIHKRVHTGEKPYKCPSCDKSFAQLTNLERHKITHTKERPHKCTVCTAGFISTSDLKRHMRIHTNERPYKCSACSKSFRTSGNLKIHLRTHTNEKPYICKICSRSFATTSNFKMHMKKHEEEQEQTPQPTPQIIFVNVLQ